MERRFQAPLSQAAQLRLDSRKKAGINFAGAASTSRVLKRACFDGIMNGKFLVDLKQPSLTRGLVKR
jgi:hypothetical protein